MPPSGRPSLWTLATRTAGALAYLGLASLLLSGVTRRPFLPVMAGVLIGVLFVAGVTLVWMARWALRDSSRAGQFSIASVLLVTAFAAGFFGAVRWLVTNLDGGRVKEPEDVGAVAILCVFLALVGIPMVLFLMEGLVWLAAWIVRWRWVQRMLAGVRGRSPR